MNQVSHITGDFLPFDSNIDKPCELSYSYVSQKKRRKKSKNKKNKTKEKKKMII